MKYKTILSFALSLLLVISSLPVYAASFEDGAGKDEIPYGPFDNAQYKYQTFNMMTAAEAKAAGVPDGYSGNVLKLTAGGGAGGVGVGLDLSQYRVIDIECITFRVYCPSNTSSNGVRLQNGDRSWIMLASPGQTGKWVDIVLDEAHNFNTEEKSFDVLDDGTGHCIPLNFCFRFSSSVQGESAPAYIDHIRVTLKAKDTTPPVITYNGPTKINLTAGRKFSIDATAYDAYHKKAIAPEYVFSNGAVDGNGLLNAGQHTCRVKFTDPDGNTSYIELTLAVSGKDTEAPVFDWKIDTIEASVSARLMLTINAVDAVDGVCVTEFIFSEGALDARNRLCEGRHTLTVCATDGTGNQANMVISVVVKTGLVDCV